MMRNYQDIRVDLNLYFSVPTKKNLEVATKVEAGINIRSEKVKTKEKVFLANIIYY